MPVEENLKKLSEFCNNLGKCFRKLTEETESKFKQMESKIRDLQCKNNTMELELAKVKEEDNSSKSNIIEAKIKEIYEGQLK